MPPTTEVLCTDDSCYLDLFECHFTYDVPNPNDIESLSCPVCGGTSCLERVEL